MRRAALIGAALGLAGCERVPSFFGYWDIVEADYDGVVQEDAGFFEIVNGGGVYVFVRYQWTGAEFVPDPKPQIVASSSSQTAPEPFEGYAKRGEEFDISIGPFGTFHVEEYDGSSALLVAESAYWPYSDEVNGYDPSDFADPYQPLPGLPLTLVIQR